MEVTEFNFKAVCDLWGCLEAAVASEATKIPVRGNMHIDTRVIKVADFKLGVNCDFWGRLEAAKASEATKIPVIDNICMYISVIKAANNCS